MRSFLAAAAAVFLVVGPAAARDLEGAAPVLQQWAGAYVGIHGGYGHGNRNGCFDLGFTFLNYPVVSAPPPVDSCEGAPDVFTFDYPQDQQGGLVGIQLGYNWLPTQNFLVGVELSASATSMNGLLNNNALAGFGQWNSIIAATVKAGVTKGKWLLYAEGGVAAANADFMGDLGCDFNVTHTGPLAGLGVAVKLSERVSLDLKYDHIWLNPAQSSCAPFILDPNILEFPTQIRSQGSLDVVKLGLNFALGSLSD
jgi:opacity protein-like surface antigen